MGTIDLTQIEKLLEENKLQEAKAIVVEYLKTPLSDAEKGEVYASLAALYLDINNRINRAHLAVLEEANSALSDINKAEQQIKDKIDLAAAQAKVKAI